MWVAVGGNFGECDAGHGNAFYTTPKLCYVLGRRLAAVAPWCFYLVGLGDRWLTHELQFFAHGAGNLGDCLRGWISQGAYL